MRPRRERHKKESPIKLTTKLLMQTFQVIATVTTALKGIEWVVNVIKQLFK